MIAKLVISFLAPVIAGFGAEDGSSLAARFSGQVNRRLTVPEAERQNYGNLLKQALAERNLTAPQYVVLVDRSAMVQAAMIYWMSSDGEFHFIGASPVSTGLPGRFEHFQTPLGVFEHTTDNLDFRAEGTKNEFGVRGYGKKGMRVYDFGWQEEARGWGKGGEGIMRLQMHSTDPDLLEQRVGTAQSKGCIRIPATMNTFIDHYGILDGDYDEAMAEGKTFWVLRSDRAVTPWSGRFLVVVDTGRKTRPDWAALPGKKKK
ncbi:MAG TPA: L,D-transpeptidase [Bryobacteraceae bacterium]|nr:L,D-transpeptidase [Bryobacteraceae bacterium]